MQSNENESNAFREPGNLRAFPKFAMSVSSADFDPEIIQIMLRVVLLLGRCQGLPLSIIAEIVSSDLLFADKVITALEKRGLVRPGPPGNPRRSDKGRGWYLTAPAQAAFESNSGKSVRKLFAMIDRFRDEGELIQSQN